MICWRTRSLEGDAVLFTRAIPVMSTVASGLCFLLQFSPCSVIRESVNPLLTDIFAAVALADNVSYRAKSSVRNHLNS